MGCEAEAHRRRGPLERIMASEPRIVAGCRMPSKASISAQDKHTYAAARRGSEALLRALQRYFAKGGRG